jgi:hypothetical protein
LIVRLRFRAGRPAADPCNDLIGNRRLRNQVQLGIETAGDDRLQQDDAGAYRIEARQRAIGIPQVVERAIAEHDIEHAECTKVAGMIEIDHPEPAMRPTQHLRHIGGRSVCAQHVAIALLEEFGEQADASADLKHALAPKIDSE